MSSPKTTAFGRQLTVVVLALVMFVASPISAWAATSITLTLVRHAQSMDNVVHVLGTVAPGPDLSPEGFVQAENLRDTLAASGIAYDAIYASTLIRTQQTATPYAVYRGIPITVLDGLREVRAGADEGAITKPVDARMQNYIDVQDAWRGGRSLTRMPQDPDPLDPNPATNANGDLNGIVFNDRTNTAIRKIYWDEMNRYPTFTADAVNPDANPLAFSHNGTITSWVLMNVENPDLALIKANSLKNTGRVVVVGNPEDGWTLVSWAGVPVSATPSLRTAVFVDLRNYSAVWQRAAWDIAAARATGDARQVFQAVGAGTAQILTATVALPGELVRDVTGAVVHGLKPAGAGAAQLKPNFPTAPVAATPRPAGAGIDAVAPPPKRAAIPVAESKVSEPRPAASTAGPTGSAAARSTAGDRPLSLVGSRPAAKRTSVADSTVPQQRRSTGGTKAPAPASSSRVRAAA